MREEFNHVITNRRCCLLDTTVVPSLCTESDHHLRVKIRFCCELGKNSCNRPSSRQAVYDENILNEILSNHDGKIKHDPSEDSELLIKELESCAELASVTQSRRSDCISTTTKELLAKRKKLRLDPNATHLARVISSCWKQHKKDLV